MANEIRFSADAELDLDTLSEFTALRFGEAQERKYKDSLRRALELLLAFPNLGADQDHLAPGLRRHVHGSHAVYYSQHSFGVLIERILGPGQDPIREFSS